MLLKTIITQNQKLVKNQVDIKVIKVIKISQKYNI